jgi:ABC-2 type transport system permease protein
VKNKSTQYKAFRQVFFRECIRLVSNPIYMFGIIVAPLFCYVFFTTLMSAGMPSNFPVGFVDMDHSKAARTLARNLDSFQETKIIAHYPTAADATQAMQSGRIYGFYYIPHNTSVNVYGQRQPRLSFYTNNSIIVAGSLLFKDFKLMSELASAYATREVLYGHGITEKQSLPLLQPITIDPHPIGNPWINYSIYLNNTMVPGILMILIFMMTVYVIGVEIKDRTARDWLHLGNNSIWISLYAKLLPQTILFTIMGILYNVYLYGYLHFPCNSSIMSMLFATFCFVLACQSMGVVMIGTLPTLRFGLSFATLWGVVSFSISGFTYPVMAMHPSLQALSNLFPLRHYFLIYVDQALNGYPMLYSWRSYLALLLFMMLPFFIAHRLKSALIFYKYIP